MSTSRQATGIRTRLATLSLGLAILIAGAGSASAATIHFDGITSNISSGIPGGYAGFNWAAMAVIQGTFHPGSGYDFGTVSPSYVAFGGGSGDLNPAVISSGATFTFNSVYLTAAWRNNLTLVVQGFNGATQLYGTTLTLSNTAPTLFQANWTAVDKITFLSSFGTQVGNLQYALDNVRVNESVTAVPEPTTLSLLAIGLAGASARRFRTRKDDATSIPT